jgi:hypothetical protein
MIGIGVLTPGYLIFNKVSSQGELNDSSIRTIQIVFTVMGAIGILLEIVYFFVMSVLFERKTGISRFRGNYRGGYGARFGRGRR